MSISAMALGAAESGSHAGSVSLLKSRCKGVDGKGVEGGSCLAAKTGQDANLDGPAEEDFAC